MITWAKKKFKQIYQYRAKGTFCDYMGDYKKKLKNSTPFEGQVVLRLKNPPIWADWAEDINFYLLKECCFLIFFYSLPCSHKMYLWPYIG